MQSDRNSHGGVNAEELARLHGQRLAWLDQAQGDILALPTDYPDGFRVQLHRHKRAQLLHARTGVVLVDTAQGRWMVPPDHAMWIPAGVDHAVDMLGVVRMQSLYVRPEAVPGLTPALRVVGMTELMRSLIAEAVTIPADSPPGGRAGLVMGLLLHEIAALPQVPLGLPFPAEPRLAALCRRFVEKPSQRVTIDAWAARLGMSRRSFTRLFQRETGLGLSVWRQQACLFAAVPRLADGEPVTSVALDLGYESVPAFTTMFKRMLGASPRAYLAAGKARA